MDFNSDAIRKITDNFLRPLSTIILKKDDNDFFNMIVSYENKLLDYKDLKYIQRGEEFLKLKNLETYDLWDKIKTTYQLYQQKIFHTSELLNSQIKLVMTNNFPSLYENFGSNLPLNSYSLPNLNDLVLNHCRMCETSVLSSPALFYEQHNSFNEWILRKNNRRFTPIEDLHAGKGYESLTDLDLIKSDDRYNINKDKIITILKIFVTIKNQKNHLIT